MNGCHDGEQGEISLLGWLYGWFRQACVKRELIILIQPHIVDSARGKQ
jgi:type II secretory pathway component GspD/PulD (secretin)